MVYRQIDGHLVSIIFLGQDRDADFFARLYADYLRQYGEPERQSTTFGGTITYGTGSGITSVTSTSTGVLNVWRQGGTKIKLVKSPGNGYNLIFTVRPEKFIH